jgi:hypothetical protein
MYLALRLKKFHILGFLWAPLCIGMETPTQEPSNKQGEQEIEPLQQLPGELVAYLSTFLTSAQNIKEAIENIKSFASTDKRMRSIINDPATLGKLIELLSTHFHTRPLKVGLTFNTKAAFDWLKSYFQKSPEVIKEGEEQLLSAAVYGPPSFVKLLLDAGINPNTRGSNNITPLIAATTLIHPEIVKILIRKDADVNARNNSGMTALMQAALFPKATDIAKLLIKAGAKLDLQSNFGNTALIIAVKIGNTEGAELLIKAGADPNIQGAYLTTPLILAAQTGLSKIVDLLIKAKADPNIRAANNKTALTLAKELLAEKSPDSDNYEDYVDTVKLLKEAGATE